ncbi:TPA: hypothetical protein JBH57_14000, partial [Legionella pneumophila]|nr:hypothetical protein [Legionella pneumophila]
NFRKIIEAKSKQEVEAIIKNIIIQEDEFSNFIINCGLLGLYWQKKHNTFLSKEDKVSDEEKDLFSTSNDSQLKRKIFRKMIAEHDKKKYISVHAFYNLDKSKWHIFYFDFKDIEKIENHHGLPHLHYISYLWGNNFKLDDVWKMFNQRKVSLPKIHIRWERH